MNRADFLKLTFTLSAAICIPRSLFAGYDAKRFLHKRCRPGDTQWPSEKSWTELSQKIKGRLIKLESPFKDCKGETKNQSCEKIFDNIKNPYYIGDYPALTQISGWLNAWTASVSVYAVRAEDSGDVAAAVNFARINNLRLVIKGGGHSYQGTSNAPDSLLGWTKAMNKVELHDAFIPSGSNDQVSQKAVTIGAGAIWMQVYNTVSVKGGRYVQGGGCATVGVAGLIQSGGFGSYSKNYGLASASLLEAEM
ncbi:FAD-binding oxidoreductase [Chryseobacterium phocaeense]|uniref:FAD-binding oxidoreductase n=1 Tax=Chryseobacterium phocaeense TaxID=1816690 RepID=UPI001E55A329|nr:FAD-dependent oxidoreductase [Chryseobacterium phocaeense]